MAPGGFSISTAISTAISTGQKAVFRPRDSPVFVPWVEMGGDDPASI
jgi:hypothetical protein